jgi:hypothetical protein
MDNGSINRVLTIFLALKSLQKHVIILIVKTIIMKGIFNSILNYQGKYKIRDYLLLINEKMILMIRSFINKLLT